MENSYLKTPQSQPKPKGDSWPHVPAQPGKFYGITDQHGMKVTAMLHDTWVDWGTLVEKLQRAVKEQENALKRQHEAIFHLNQANKALAAEKAAIEEKHKNLRRAYRKIKRDELAEVFEEPKQEVSAPSSFNPLAT